MDDDTMADKRAPRIQLPVLIDDASLSPYGFRLYAHIKRRAGEDGSCFEGTRSIAEVCRMSVGQVSKAKAELKAAGLITMGKRATKGGMVDELWIVDVWAENAAKYPSVHTVNTNDTVQDTNTNQPTVQQVNTSTVSVHHTNTKEQETPVSVHTVNDSVHTVNVRRSIEETKSIVVASDDAPTAQPEKKKRPAKTEPQSPIEIRRAIAKGSQIDLKTGLQKDIIQVNNVAGTIWNKLRTPDQSIDSVIADIRSCAKWVRTSQHPYKGSEQCMPPSALIRFWTPWQEAEAKAKPHLNGHANGSSAPVLPEYDYDTELNPNSAEYRASLRGPR